MDDTISSHSEKIEAKIAEAVSLFTKGDIEEAQEILLEVVEQAPRSFVAYNGLATIAWQLGEQSKALGLASRAMMISPSDKDTLLNYAVILKNMGRPEEALGYVESFLESNPDDTEVKAVLEDLQKRIAEAGAKQEKQEDGNPASEECKSSGLPEDEESPVHIAMAKPKSDSDLGLISRASPIRPESEYDFPSLLASKGSFENGPLGRARVLHAPYEIAGCIERFSRMLRAKNVDALGVNYYNSWLNYECDVGFGFNNMSDEQRVPILKAFAREAMERFDIFHFHFSHSLFADLHDLEELKNRGKKVLFSFWGSDSRAPEVVSYHQAKFLGLEPPRPYFNTLKQYAQLKAINRYADVMLGLTCIPRYLFFPGFADTKQWSLDEKRKILEKSGFEKNPHKTYIVHAPSSAWKKGSNLILSVLEECKSKGMPIELLYVSEMAPDKAREIYALADFAIDQVSVGTFGLFGIEMMCWEIPVIAYQTKFFDEVRNHPPVLSVQRREDLVETIERCVELKRSGENLEIGRKSRQWAIGHVDIQWTLPQLVKIYGKLLENKPVRQNIDLGWFQQEQRMLDGVKSDFYRYLKESNAAERFGITVADYDTRLYS